MAGHETRRLNVCVQLQFYPLRPGVRLQVMAGRRRNQETAHQDLERAYDDLVDLVIATAPGGELVANRGKEAGVTDRALRYRANADPPPGPRVCLWCGSRRNVEVGHIDGFEEHNEPENLAWTCRACNSKMAAVFKAAGRGRRTHQYNPAGGAKTAAQFFTALSVTHGQSSDMTLDEAVQLIHDTPDARRSRFQREAWSKRKRMYGRSGRRSGGRDEVPF